MPNPTRPDDAHAPGDEHCGPVARPQFQLRSLPIPTRWEVTRRHPYYLMFWETARRHIRGEFIENSVESLMGQAACAFLATIGVSGEPIDPGTSFEDLGKDELHNAWMSGAVHPITCRGLVGLLLAALPKETLGKLGDILKQASCDDPEDGTPRSVEAFQLLQQADNIGLDDYANEPIVSVDPTASERKVKAAIGKLLNDWKSERELSERRDRSDNYPNYLEVWDLREGWTGSDYDPLAEKTFQEIAQTIVETPSTVSNHYRRAFELITGHPYRPGLWYRIFMPHKVDLLGFEESPVSRRRPSTSPSRAPVPESRLGVDFDVIASSQGSTNSSAGQEIFEVVGNITKLLEEGKSDQEIMNSLEMIDNPSSRRLIAYLRRRDD